MSLESYFPDSTAMKSAPVNSAYIVRQSGVVRNVFEAIVRYGHDEDFVPTIDSNFVASDAMPGSPEKIEELRKRARFGLPLWHPHDRLSYDDDER
jgi:hypothetical protein